MSKQKLLQRLVAALATNEGVQPKRTEICQRLKSLTPREFDVLCYILGGQLNREIAAELDITVRTIKHHRGRVMEKLGVQSTAQLFPMLVDNFYQWGSMSIAVLYDKVVEKKNPASTFVQVDPILVTEESVKKFRDTWRDWIHGK
ncbi:MAG TPA: LuxR C-terminal-related transcriptional regulator [Chthoniobacterales bacterium]|nr:LuxR C-terminal-related transcriptional regulator [Chthoniobacterales bacterium]